MYCTDRTLSPDIHPELYRTATVADIVDGGVDGFYNYRGAYWRKNGGVRLWRTRPAGCGLSCPHKDGHARVPTKFGMWVYGQVDHDNVYRMFVRLNEVYTPHGVSNA